MSDIVIEDWKKLELSEIFEISKNKFNPKTSDENKKCIELEHISQGTGKLLGYTNSSEQQSIKNIFRKDQVLFGKLRPYLKKYWKASFDGVCSTEIWVLTGINVTNNYLFQLVQTNKFNQIANVSSGSKMPRADWKYMVEIPFDIPPLKEQEKIAQILTTWDEAISKQEQLITTKERLKKGLMQKLLSGEVRFEGFDEEWEEVKLGDVANIKKGKQLNKSTLTKEGDYPVINGGITPSGYTNDFNTQENTITISEGGNSCGFINFITEKFWSGGHCYTLQEPQINNTFLYQILKLDEHRIMRLRVGSGLPNIQKKDIDNFKILSPSLEEQQKIAQVLTLADKEIELLKEELETLKEQKKGLMQRLLTGEVRVNV